MPARARRQYRFTEPRRYPTKNLPDLSGGLDTKRPETEVAVRRAENVRFGLSSGFQTRAGSQRKGNSIGSANKIDGLHSYVKTDSTAYLLADYNGDIYKYVESGASATIATSTNSNPTGLSKDRKVFFTTASTGGNPYVVAFYQSGAGIILEWSASPYSSWANTPITIDASTATGFDCYIDASDNFHVVYNDTANSVKYVKLTYAAGPTWSVGTKYSIAGTGVNDSATNPSFAIQSAGTMHVAYMHYNGTDNSVRAHYSIDSGVTWSAFQSVTSGGDPYQVAMVTVSDTPVMIIKEVDVTADLFTKSTWSTTWSVPASYTPALGTSVPAASFSVVVTGTTETVYVGSGTSGTSLTSFGTAAGTSMRVFSVVNDGVNDNDIQYNSVTAGSVSPTASRVTNDALNNLKPVSPANVSATSSYVPVVFVSGTASPYNVKINSSVQWSALSASLTAGYKVESATMPSTAAGGTGLHYFTNNKEAMKKWDGTTLTTATAVGFPKAAWVFAMDNRLHFGGGTGFESTWWYTNLGADNFAGTFPTSNRVDFPEALLHGLWYRDSVAMFFTRTGVYTVQNFDYTGVSVGPEVIRRIPDSYGTLSARSVKQVGYWVYYQRPDGQMMRTNGQYAELVSDNIFPTLQNISLAQLSNAAAGTYGPYYFLSVTDSGDGQNGTIIVLDTRKAPNGGFSIDTGKYASVFASHPDENGVPRIYFGDSRSTMGSVYQMETGNDDNGTDISCVVETGVMVTGDLYSKDELRDILVVTEATSGATFTVGWTGYTNTNLFTSRTFSIDTQDSSWGIGTWGDGRIWGGITTIEELITNLFLRDRGFKFKYSCVPSEGTINFVSQTFTYERINDRP